MSAVVLEYPESQGKSDCCDFDSVRRWGANIYRARACHRHACVFRQRQLSAVLRRAVPCRAVPCRAVLSTVPSVVPSSICRLHRLRLLERLCR